MNAAGAVVAILFVIALIIIGPIFTISAVNVLFGTSIPITIFTWLSALWLQILVYGARKGNK